jgi:malate dehydrogenase (oxaloacetate-decarboxylating)(NADP+)
MGWKCHLLLARWSTNKEGGTLMTQCEEAIAYHADGTPGKLSVVPTKPLRSKQHLSLAYSPGVACASLAIKEDPGRAFSLTAKGNLVGVVSDGSAVLGLGDIGPLASKPVMEGKAILFKKLAGVDSFDLEMLAETPRKLAEYIKSLEPTFGGINLEDIRAPDCFLVEEELKKCLNIPVFHDDQHGTAIVVTAAILNGLSLAQKTLEVARVVVSGAGAGALASLGLLTEFGLSLDRTFVFDSQGLICQARQDLSPYKTPYASHARTLSLQEALQDADVFIGLSRAQLLEESDVARMADHPLILALANPGPEIRPEKALKAKPSAMVATGRSDYPNQVNNVLCFPYLFRGALDVGAHCINQDMKHACVQALRDLTPRAAAGESAILLPQPLEPKLLTTLPVAVAKAAMASGVATRPLKDMEAYVRHLEKLGQTLQAL